MTVHDAVRILTTLYLTYWFMPYIEYMFGMVEYA